MLKHFKGSCNTLVSQCSVRSLSKCLNSLLYAIVPQHSELTLRHKATTQWNLKVLVSCHVVGSPVIMHPSVLKALLTGHLLAWAVYPMGKRALILKGSASYSTILVTAMKGLLCFAVTIRCIFVSTLYHTVQYSTTVLPSCGVGYVRKLITLHSVYS